ncbi:ABC transporter substrate-binding protein [Peribacillus cavernae]|uniref:ABC transporter substrate-binding protein n=1 Tax=Peribacillus cavernae TaxID=1674310 RepID=A0A433HIW9_9BACI|nr:substrate-binding domain-containing protein [Peribacillus cavernae]MDQ0217723.1 ribose transport system substrate-binding protein [Peribacillus cavernae]RUQ28189.1 ABC transporter substrate-binding protein [Peribacillus cavernae]
MKRKITVFLSLLVILTLLLSACSSNKSTTGSQSNGQSGNFALEYKSKKKDGFIIGFSNGYFGNTWRSQYVDGVKRVTAELKKEGIVKEVNVQNTNGVPAQIAAVESFINSGVDAIVINPVSSSSLAPVVAKAISKGILVVVSESGADYPNTVVVGGDNAGFWRIQTKWLAEQLKGKGDIVEINGIAGNVSDELRTRESKDILKKYPDIKVLGSAPGGWDPTKGQQAMSNFLSTHSKIDGVLVQDQMAGGVIQAFEAAKRPLPVMTGDFTYGFLRMWKDKYPDLNTMTIPYNTGIGANSIRVAVKLLQGNKLKPESLSPNPLKKELKNTIISTVPYVITKEAQPDAPWMEGEDSKIKAIGLDEAVKMGEGKGESIAVESIWTEEEVDQMFNKPAN